LLQAANTTVRTTTARQNPWQKSIFAWLKHVPPVARGTAGAEMVAEMLRGFGYHVSAGPIAQSFCVKSHVVKVKMSMSWAGARVFKFQQIEDDPYTHLAMLGLEPATAWFWLCPKEAAWKKAEAQHRGESRWIQVSIGRPPKWLEAYGGLIDTAQATRTAQLGKP
jgi:hypothetical protein